MASEGSKPRRSSKKNILYEDDPEAQYEVAYRKKKIKLKSGNEKTTLVAESLLEEVIPAAIPAQALAAPAVADDGPMSHSHDFDVAESAEPSGRRPPKV